MDTHYTVEKHTQILIALLKAHGVRKVVASPGTTNITFVASIQSDSWFEIYSSVDERSAAYIACGLAAESGEPVVLSCTGATASRNYIPGLTEAYYRKLPILAITSAQHLGRVGTYSPQVLDRSTPLKDICVYDCQADVVNSAEDEWALNVTLNKALTALRKNGGGPVHINLVTTYNKDFSVKELPSVRVIHHIGYHDTLPKLKKGRIGIYVGNHEKWSDKLTQAVDEFCELYDGVVICDHTSNYRGKYRIEPSLLCGQVQYQSPCTAMSVMIHIGYVSGASIGMKPCEVWRVNPDGEIRDTFRKTSYVLQMEEEDFFNIYVRLAKNKGVEELSAEELFALIDNAEDSAVAGGAIADDIEVTEDAKTNGDEGESTNDNASTSYYAQWKNECDKIAAKVPELPFSNAWIAKNTAAKLPENSVLHLGILNTLRVWNFFEIPESVLGYSNTGGFGIDGDVSALLGASLGNPDKLFFGVVGDLAFFYDMNVLGNRHFGKNVRLMLVNNGRGTEFRNYNHPAARFGEDADAYMAAAGHFGNKSPELIKHYATDLGFEYMSASNKEEYLSHLDRFLTKEITDRPMLFEVFTDSADESHVLEILYGLESNTKGAAKKFVKSVLGEKGVAKLKSMMGK